MSTIFDKPLGAIPSPWTLKRSIQGFIDTAFNSIPQAYDMRPLMFPVRDQGSLGDCVAEACSNMKDYQERTDKTYTPVPQPTSPLYIFNLKWFFTVNCMIPLNALMILRDKGIALESWFPYSETNTKKPDRNLIERSKIFRIAGFARVFSVEQAKQAMLRFGPIIICFPVYNYGPTFWKKGTGDTLHGYHCVTLVGWNGLGFILRNSWGADWNGSGETTLPFADFSLNTECWSTIDDSAKEYYVKMTHPVKYFFEELVIGFTNGIRFNLLSQWVRSWFTK
jgi:hypothetical protein